ncbi:hypothetical protein FKW77_007978 [Venturia effusa]|uniref:Uncharacterized protein n=1 Tax=Venturia effusa TaxID=50376 RepID=A0A517L7S8_9PEZI|nr:hypothetical protein FKW77_007978 [Venturia effusa]
MKFLATFLSVAALSSSGLAAPSASGDLSPNVRRTVNLPTVDDTAPACPPARYTKKKVACMYMRDGGQGYNRLTGYTKSCCGKNQLCGDICYLTVGSEKAFDDCAFDSGRRADMRVYDNTACDPLQCETTCNQPYPIFNGGK